MIRSALPLSTFVAALSLASCISGPHADVQLSPGAALGDYEVIYLMPESPWIANHSITGLLIQEVERRGLVVKMGAPPEEAQVPGTLMLKLVQAGEKKESGSGATNKLRYLSFRIRDYAKGDLASVEYSGSTLDLIDQKTLVRGAADELFGPR